MRVIVNTRMYKFLFRFVIIFLPNMLAGASLPDSLLHEGKSFGFRYENDFFTATDRYYTQGIKIESTGKWWRKSPFSKLLIRSKKKGIHQFGLSGEQNCFTPRSIRVDSIYRGERPYAATAMLSHFAVMYFPKTKQRIKTQLALGVIGPCAICEEEQKGIHHALNNIQPLGWEYQLATDYIVNYNLTYEKGYLNNPYIDAIWSSELRVGSLYTDATTLVTMRIGKLRPYFIPIQKEKKFYAFLFVKSAVKYVFYNATLQGGIFNKNSVYTLPASEIMRAVLYSNTGITLQYNKCSLDYSYTWISPEVKHGLGHGWGSVDFSFRF